MDRGAWRAIHEIAERQKQLRNQRFHFQKEAFSCLCAYCSFSLKFPPVLSFLHLYSSSQVLSLNVLSSGNPLPQSQMDQVILSMASVASTSSSRMSPFPSIIHAVIGFMNESISSRRKIVASALSSAVSLAHSTFLQTTYASVSAVNEC